MNNEILQNCIWIWKRHGGILGAQSMASKKKTGRECLLERVNFHDENASLGNWGSPTDIDGRVYLNDRFGYEGSHKPILRDLVRRG